MCATMLPACPVLFVRFRMRCVVARFVRCVVCFVRHGRRCECSQHTGLRSFVLHLLELLCGNGLIRFCPTEPRTLFAVRLRSAPIRSGPEGALSPPQGFHLSSVGLPGEECPLGGPSERCSEVRCQYEAWAIQCQAVRAAIWNVRPRITSADFLLLDTK